jgi:hypothetical protein
MKLLLNIPDDLANRLTVAAARSLRSRNAEIGWRLEESFKQAGGVEEGGTNAAEVCGPAGSSPRPVPRPPSSTSSEHPEEREMFPVLHEVSPKLAKMIEEDPIYQQAKRNATKRERKSTCEHRVPPTSFCKVCDG